MKICSKCGINKALEDYYSNNRHKDGKKSECKSCSKDIQKDYYIEHKRQKLEYQKEYNKTEKGRLTIAKYSKSNKGTATRNKYEKSDKAKLTRFEYEKSDRGKLVRIKYAIEYDKSDKGKASKARRNHNRRTNIANSKTILTAKEFNCILSLQNYQCVRPDCESGKFFDNVKPTKDHINPVTKGGDFIKNNVQLLCQSCNSKKGIKYIDYRSDMHKKIIETI